MKSNIKNIISRSLLIAASSLLPLVSSAQEQGAPATSSYLSNSLFNTLLAVIIVLAIMVMALSSALKNIIASDFFIEKIKKEREQPKPSVPGKTALIILFMLLSLRTYSQETIQMVKDDRIGGLDQFTFYAMIVTIALEIGVLGILFNTFKNILVTKKAVIASEKKPQGKTILDKLNGTVELEHEHSILLDHDYDGIKELDNDLPPWWKYGFYLTIAVAVIYLIVFHVIGTAPLQKQEYSNSVKKAEAEIAEYMKNSANNVDETTVKLLTDPADLAGGKELFIGSCAACHGRAGEGGVGPNLTDDYWLHGGSVRDIFKTIKYGWADKGMKAWKEDFSPVQIAQITSFIRSLKGSNPPKPKDKQGELYIEQVLPVDSAAIKADSTITLASELLK